MVAELRNIQEFKDFLVKPSESKTKLVHFSAQWAASSNQLNDLLDELHNEYKQSFDVAKIDAESLAEVSLEYNVKAVPTIISFKDGKLADRIEGFHPALLRDLVVKSTFDTNAGCQMDDVKNKVAADGKEDLNERLKRLINKSRLTLFMKGSPDTPKCGFSRQIVDILQQNNVEFWTFDILQDEEVRQGLKAYSDWPTYPQLYLDGELLGGLDVIKEEMKDPAFVDRLPKTS